MIEYESRQDNRSPEQPMEVFERTYAPFMTGEQVRQAEDGTRYDVRAYELTISPTDTTDRQNAVAAFVLDALGAGYRPALGPLVIPNIGERDDGDGGKASLTALHFFLERRCS